MTKILLTLSIIILFMTGCSRTIHGIQQDSQDVWDDAKGAVHNATAP